MKGINAIAKHSLKLHGSATAALGLTWLRRIDGHLVVINETMHRDDESKDSILRVEIVGDTYPLRETLSGMGYTWDKALSVWASEVRIPRGEKMRSPEVPASENVYANREMPVYDAFREAMSEEYMWVFNGALQSEQDNLRAYDRLRVLVYEHAVLAGDIAYDHHLTVTMETIESIPVEVLRSAVEAGKEHPGRHAEENSRVDTSY
ncbi:MAG: hypothetical protein K8L99_33825 [Anaerolineae bacterium]|nr:hypothetical protein [Anaerolineae bacterium]